MLELKGFPLLSQLDGDSNAEYDCVPTAIAAGLCYLTGQQFSGGKIKDVVYGAPYVGATAVTNYADYCRQHGVTLSSASGSGAQLTSTIRTQLAAGHPVLAIEPDPYVSSTLRWTHAVVFFAADKSGTNTLTAMDPYIAQAVTKSDQEWASTIQFQEVWPMFLLQREEEHVGGIPQGWSDDGTKLQAPQCQYHVVNGFRNWILTHAWEPANIPLENENHVSQLELSNPALGAGQRQRFRTTSLEYTSKQGVFVGWTGPELLAMEQRIQSLEGQVQKLQPAGK
jgi:hypothetical protein